MSAFRRPEVVVFPSSEFSYHTTRGTASFGPVNAANRRAGLAVLPFETSVQRRRG
jgi:hypothetical protein